MATTNFITNQEFRDYAPDVDLSRYTETTISGFIGSATRKAEKFIEYSLIFETKEETSQGIVDDNLDLVIFPRKLPVQALNSATITKGNFSSAITLTDGTNNHYNIPTSKDRIRINVSSVTLNSISIINLRALRNNVYYVTVNYDCGYNMNDRPEDIMEAVVLYARDQFAKSLNGGGASRITQGAVSMDYSQRKGKSDHVRDAEEILQHYKVVAGF